MTTEVHGLDAVVAKLDGLDDPSVFRRPMTQAVAHLQRALAKYPPPARKPQPFKTEKQRRFFFWALRTGKIRVPYRRTGTLGRRWTTEVSPDGREGRVGNNTPYGPYVQDRERQSGYHQGTWQTAQDVAEREQAAVVGYFEEQYRRYTKE